MYVFGLKKNLSFGFDQNRAPQKTMYPKLSYDSLY